VIASNGREHAHEREIARGLAAAVAAAIESARAPERAARGLSWGAAAGVAELLGLPGLTALLGACEAHAEAPPLAVDNVLERLARLAAETEALGDIAPFSSADRELGALAGMLGAQEWAAPSEARSRPESVQSLSALLADFQVDDAAAIARAQLTLPVAAGVRAALDWLGADLGGPLRVTVHDTSLTLTARVAHEPGLAPAGAVLGLMGGALLPEPDGRWALRVPLHVARPAFLLARQGELSLALPWHAVSRLRIADESARAAMTEPMLEPWSALARASGERPAALLAQGLSRAWLHLDHIVWRVFAGPEPGLAPAAVPGGHLLVRTEEGGEFWVVDVEAALRDVPQLHTPPPRTRARAAAAAETPLAQARPAAPPAADAPEPAAEPALLVLTAAHAHPLASPPARSEAAKAEPAHVPAPPSVPAPVLVPAPQPAAVPAPPLAAPRREPIAREVPPAAPMVLDASAAQPLRAAPVARAERRALIVDDSLVARMALARVLELDGWVVEGAETASQMWDLLLEAEWTVVFVDVSLPDASGRAHLRSLVARQLVTARRFELVALTRDGAERRLADDAGITRTLQKPFAAGAIELLLRDLPGPAAGA
jgi:CheY-like chemotaxis protein